mgnify:CR=1 FL=1
MWFDIIKNAEPSSREVLQGYFTSLVISYIQEELPLDSKNPWTAWRDNKVLVV